MCALRAKMETVALTNPVTLARDTELDLAFEYVAEFFAFVLNETVAASAWFNMIDIARKQMSGRARNHCFELYAFASANLIGLDYRPFPAPQHDALRVPAMLEQTGDGSTEGRRDPMDHFKGRIGAAIL